HALHKDWQDASRSHADAVRSNNEKLEVRRAELQKQLDDFAERNNMPKTTLKLVDDLKGAGAYDAGQGVIKINARDLATANGAKDLIHTLFHEAVHSDQDHLIVRQMMEDIRKGKPGITRDELFKEVRKQYQKEFEFKEALSDQVLNEAARLHEKNGNKLAPHESDRATALRASWKDHLDKRYHELGDTSRVIQTELNRLNSNSATKVDRLLEHLNSNKGDNMRVRRMFGDKPIPDEIAGYMKAQETGQPFDRQKA